MSLLLAGSARARFTIPVFLAPAFIENTNTASTIPSTKAFSTSIRLEQQHKKGKINKQRGVSALRSTGPRTKLSLPPRFVLPVPAQDYEARRKEFDDADDEHGLSSDHGLWQFFRSDKSALISPLDESSHGRAWTMSELGQKSFDDLWRLYWICVKEANQVVTRDHERSRVYAGYGAGEAEDRLKTVRATQARIRRVLVQRHEDRSMAQTYLEQIDLDQVFPEEARRIESQLRSSRQEQGEFKFEPQTLDVQDEAAEAEGQRLKTRN